MLATLNHPHVGAIYGIEDVDGVPALVLELVEGQTLAERLGFDAGGSDRSRFGPRGRVRNAQAFPLTRRSTLHNNLRARSRRPTSVASSIVI
jgi:hypothetical protein